MGIWLSLPIFFLTPMYASEDTKHPLNAILNFENKILSYHYKCKLNLNEV